MLTGVSPKNTCWSRLMVTTSRCSVTSRTVRVLGTATSIPSSNPHTTLATAGPGSRSGFAPPTAGFVPAHGPATRAPEVRSFRSSGNQRSRDRFQSPARNLFLFSLSPIPLPLLRLLQVNASQQQQEFLASVARAGPLLLRPSKSAFLEPARAQPISPRFPEKDLDSIPSAITENIQTATKRVLSQALAHQDRQPVVRLA